ncbi:NAD(P)-binding protein [Mycena chlorophos]|uniref:NAD(P)-binding protein n=1 Tax=Mycena chlorophos TaxID=658473 RepID=A0A8H6TKM5_MYCCL|nr:NAD(P)-binding protein [Mycena chlorophos]
MSPLAKAQASNAAWKPNYTPTAVIVGGTSGIGQGIAQTFAKRTNGNAHIVIVGRNEAAATTIISGFPKPPAGVSHEFVQCDLSTVAAVKRAAKTILARHAEVNFLFLTSGGVDLTSAVETSEGLLKGMGPTYYGRWAFIDGLLPALRAAHAAGHDARVLGVLNAGYGEPIDLEDMGLKKTTAKLSFSQMRGQHSTYQDLMVEGWGQHEPDITFIHAMPGAVSTNLWNHLNFPLRVILNTLFLFIAKTPEQCGEYMLYGIRTAPSGASRIDEHGDDMGLGVIVKKGNAKYAGTLKGREKLWEYTKGVVEAIKL